jgi:hypothetical protein
VRIGVVDAVDKDHLAKDGDDLPGEGSSIDAGRVEGRDIADLDALDEGGGHHAPRAVAFNGAREEDLRLLEEVIGDARDVLGLAEEVELLRDHRPHLVVVGVHPLDGDEDGDDGHDAADGGEVEPDDLVDVAVLDLDGHARAVFEAGLVDLAEGGAGDGLFAEAVEDLADGAAELGLDALGDLGVGPRGT